MAVGLPDSQSPEVVPVPTSASVCLIPDSFPTDGLNSNPEPQETTKLMKHRLSRSDLPHLTSTQRSLGSRAVFNKTFIGSVTRFRRPQTLCYPGQAPSRRIAGGRNKAGSAASGMLLVKLFTQHSRCA